MRLVQKFQHRLRLASVIFDVFLELMTKTHPKDSKFQCFVSIVWIFFLIHYENGIKIIFIGHMHVVCVCVYCVLFDDSYKKCDYEKRKHHWIRWVNGKWQKHQHRVSIFSLSLSMYLWCFGVEIRWKQDKNMPVQWYKPAECVYLLTVGVRFHHGDQS